MIFFGGAKIQHQKAFVKRKNEKNEKNGYILNILRQKNNSKNWCYSKNVYFCRLKFSQPNKIRSDVFLAAHSIM